jgi:hypothetical protein
VRHPSVSDVDRYVIIRKLPDFTWNILPGFSNLHRGILFRNVAYTKYNVPWFGEWADLNGSTSVGAEMYAVRKLALSCKLL